MLNCQTGGGPVCAEATRPRAFRYPLPPDLPGLRLFAVMLLGGYFLLIMHIPLWNNGGYGMALPQNLLAWLVAWSLVAGVSLRMPEALPLRLTPAWGYAVAGAGLMTLPVLWAPDADWLEYGIPRLLGLWSGVFFLLALLQLRLQPRHISWLTGFIAVAAATEAGIVLTGLFYPTLLSPVSQGFLSRYGRVGAGVFQQANVTASFLSTGLVLQLMLLGIKEKRGQSGYMPRVWPALLAVSVVLTCCALVLLQSRIGWLGGVLGVGAIQALFSVRKYTGMTTRTRRLALAGLPLLGCVSGTLLLNISLSSALAAHDASNVQRWLTLRETLAMIVQHPWKGWGIGSYESQFQLRMAGQVPNTSLEMMNHPHNELLFVWSEGGVSALAGLGLFIVAGVRLLRRATTVWHWGALLAMLPVLLHTQVEFPLYYSVAHFLVLLILFASADHECLSADQDKCSRVRAGMRFYTRRAGQFLVALLAVYSIGIMVQSLRVGGVLAHFEAVQLHHPDQIRSLHVPWLLQPRYRHDLSLLRLIDFETVPDPDALRLFVQENARWLATHADADMYANQILVLHYLGDTPAEHDWKAQANKMFPYDDRFSDVSPARKSGSQK